MNPTLPINLTESSAPAAGAADQAIAASAVVPGPGGASQNTGAEIVLLSVAATRFGYAEAPYFRRHVAPAHGLTFYKIRNRWYTTARELDAALQRAMGSVAE